MRPELAEPVRDQERLRRLLPIAEEVFRRHQAGQDYAPLLRQISRIAERIVDVPTFLYAFGVGDAEYFARRLLTDWHNLPQDLSESEMLELLQAVCSVQGTQDRCEYWLKCIEQNTGEPELIDLIYWPDRYREGAYDGHDLSPEEILKIALQHGRGGGRGSS
jgi:hypothetical protein